MEWPVPDYMEQSPSWETDSHSASQEIPCLLLDAKVYYRDHKSPTLGTVLSQMNPIHNLTPCLFKIHFENILTCKLVFPK
jgi:hypothetical protein